MDKKEITLDILRNYLETRKSREQKLFEYHASTDDVARATIKDAMEDIDRKILAQECEFSRQGFKPVLLREKDIEEMKTKLSSVVGEDLSSEGNLTVVAINNTASFSPVLEIFDTSKQNLDALFKLNLIFQKLGYDDSAQLIGLVRMGVVREPIDVSCFPREDTLWMVRFLQRLGIKAALDGSMLVHSDSGLSDQVHIRYQGKELWLTNSQMARLSEMMKMLKGVSQKMQSYTAQRHVRQFSPEEEADFQSVQTSYLGLIDKRDELLKTFQEEETHFLS